MCNDGLELYEWVWEGGSDLEVNGQWREGRGLEVNLQNVEFLILMSRGNV